VGLGPKICIVIGWVEMGTASKTIYIRPTVYDTVRTN